MKFTKIEDFKIGEYYHVLNENNPTFIIVKYKKPNIGDTTKTRIIGPHLTNMNGHFKYDDSSICFHNRECRLATWEERHWLDECIKVNKFIYKDKITFDYEIY